MAFAARLTSAKDDRGQTPVSEVPSQITFRGMPPVSGYEHEWLGYAKSLKEGKKECEEIPNATTLAISHIMNAVFKNAEIVFPF